MRNRTALFALIATITSVGLVAACGDDPAVTSDAGTDASATATDGSPPPPPPVDGSVDAPTDSPVAPPAYATGPSRGSAIAMSWDDSTLVVANRDSGTVSVFSVTYGAAGAAPTLARKAEITVGAEPWQVAIAGDNDTAYVVLRKDQKLVKITGLKGAAPAKGGEVAVGSEPTAVSLSPSGATAWVANWADGTVMPVNTATMAIKNTIDLNKTLIDTGLLGTGLTSRLGLAHPRSIAITNNLNADDSDESIYVTEYYGQRTSPEVAGGATSDTNHDGIVYKIAAGASTATAIRLKPIADMGFKDSNGGTAGCFPNQLQSITIQGGFAFVSHICASPKGPVGIAATATVPTANIKTTTHGAVSVINLGSGTEVAAGTASLHDRFDKLYTSKTTPDTNARRYPAVPSDIAFVKDGTVGYVAGNAVDAVFRARYGAAGELAEVGAGTSPNLFIELAPGAAPAAGQGRGPVGLVGGNTDKAKKFLFVANDITRNVQVVDLDTQALAGGAATPAFASSTAAPAAGSTAEAVLRGKRFFNTAGGRWSLNGQGWGACQSCHIDGLTDNVTWYFGRGPRQSTSLDGSYSKKDPTDRRIFNWTSVFDEVADFEGNTRGTSGGVGAIVKATSTPPVAADRIDLADANFNHNGLIGSAALAADPTNPAGLPAPSLLKDWAEITEYFKTIRSPRAASKLDAAKVAAGAAIFTEGNCQGCHGGDKWTISKLFYTPSSAASSAVGTTAWTGPAGFPPNLLPAASGGGFMRSNLGGEQLQCINREVGTFNVADPFAGIQELRQDMIAAAQGGLAEGRGFNPPSLLNVVGGAPYLHAGNAPTLESLFAARFQAHYGALAGPNFLTEAEPVRSQKVAQLIEYLLSIDDAKAVVPSPAAAGAEGGDFCELP